MKLTRNDRDLSSIGNLPRSNLIVIHIDRKHICVPNSCTAENIWSTMAAAPKKKCARECLFNSFFRFSEKGPSELEVERVDVFCCRLMMLCVIVLESLVPLGKGCSPGRVETILRQIFVTNLIENPLFRRVVVWKFENKLRKAVRPFKFISDKNAKAVRVIFRPGRLLECFA